MVLKREDVQKVILNTIAGVGLITIAVMAPNALQAFGFVVKKEKRNKKWQTVKNVLSRLEQQQIIFFDRTEKGIFVRLTPKGKKIWSRVRLEEGGIPKAKKWDGKWRVLIFDIPENRKKLRDKVRNTLVHLGFVRLQNSVWIYPYECEEYVVLLKADFKIGKDLLYMIVETLENDRFLRKLFSLA